MTPRSNVIRELSDDWLGKTAEAVTVFLNAHASGNE